MTKERIVILGAGVSGLSIAWHLERLKTPYGLFEKETEAGGVCRSYQDDGFVFDQGGHVLHFKDPAVAAFVLGLLKENVSVHRRRAFYYAFGRFAPYPFQANLGRMPAAVVRECLDGVRKIASAASGKTGPERHFRAWAVRKFGPGIVRHFLFPYNAKFWKVPLRSLATRWAEGAVPTPTFDEMIAGGKGPGAKAWGPNGTFWYPRRGGIQELPKALASSLRGVRMNCAAVKVDLSRKTVEFSTGEQERFDVLVPTIPLPELGRMIPGLPKRVRGHFEELRWNSILNLHIGLHGREAARGHWIYFPEKAFPFFRVSRPRSFSSWVVPPGRGALSVEVAYRPGRRPDAAALSRNVLDDLRRVGLLPRGCRVRAIRSCDIPYGYPVHDHHYDAARRGIFDHLRRHGVFPAGRYGGWQYMSVEDVLVEGRRLAEELAL